jgi:hypothetical protein
METASSPTASESPAELIAEARRSLGQVERMLLDPTARDIEFCRSALHRATGHVDSVRTALAGSDAGLRSPLMLESASRLCAQVSSIAILLDRAAAFHAGILQSMMQAARPEHTPVPSRETAQRVQLDA